MNYRRLSLCSLWLFVFAAACDSGPSPEKIDEATQHWCDKQALIAKMNAEPDSAKKDEISKEASAAGDKMDAALGGDTKAKAQIMKSAKCDVTVDGN